MGHGLTRNAPLRRTRIAQGYCRVGRFEPECRGRLSTVHLVQSDTRWDVESAPSKARAFGESPPTRAIVNSALRKCCAAAAGRSQQL